MSDCCSDKACELDALRQHQASVLKVVLAINAVMFIVEFSVGLVSGSASLLADSLDMLGDALVYGLSLYAVAESQKTKAISALLKGIVMAMFGLLATGQVIYKLTAHHIPSYEVIGTIGFLALVANSICFVLLWRHRSIDINMRSIWLCSRNDVVANVAVLAAAGGVWLTGRSWPDLVVGALIAALFLKSATTILSESSSELRRAQP
ncbi:MAG: cation transporter [Paralcaligenes sp.]